MNIKMAITSQLSKTESKKQSKQEPRNRIVDMELIWKVTNWEWEGGECKKRCRD